MSTPVNSSLPPYVDSTSLEPGLYGRPLILDRIFKLLVMMINVLQKTAAAQAERLQFLSEWQRAYTDELNQMHSFTAGNGDGTLAPGQTARLDNISNTTAAAARQDLNSLNSGYAQTIQGNRQQVSDDAKALQANVNQTTDAVQSQTDMATSILQQLSTILASIYQS